MPRTRNRQRDRVRPCILRLRLGAPLSMSSPHMSQPCSHSTRERHRTGWDAAQRAQNAPLRACRSSRRRKSVIASLGESGSCGFYGRSDDLTCADIVSNCPSKPAVLRRQKRQKHLRVDLGSRSRPGAFATLCVLIQTREHGERRCCAGSSVSSCSPFENWKRPSSCVR